MKVLLVNPPNANKLKFPEDANDFALSTHDLAPPIGLMYIKAYLKQMVDVDVRLYNFQTPQKPSLNDFHQYLCLFNPDIVGITVTTFFWYDVSVILKLIRNVLPEALIVGGGPHMWIYPEASLGMDRFDIIVQGPGEITFAEIVTAYKEGKSFNGIDGILYCKNGTIFKTAPPRQIENLDILPFPDRSDFDPTQFHRMTDQETATVVAITSRGCPYNCAFCDNRNRFYRARRPDCVVKELIECKRMGYRGIMFWDEVFTLIKENVLALCNEMIAQKLDMPWGCITRVDCVDQETIRVMHNAGCNSIFFGVESGSQHILDQINKKISLQQSRDAFKICRQEGIVTGAYFIIGLPGETEIEAENTFHFAEELSADYININIFFPVPGTALFKKAADDPHFDSDWWIRYISNPAPNQRIALWATGMNVGRMASLIKKFYRRYYLNPRRAINQLKKLKSKTQFPLMARAALHILLGK